MKFSFSLFKKAFYQWQEHKAPMLGAALSYYTVFSLAPLLLIIISIAGLILGPKAVTGQLFGELRGLLGDQAASTIQTMLQKANKPNQGIFTGVVSFAILLLGASGIFGQLKDSLNLIWGVKIKPKVGIWTTIRERFLSFAMVAVIGFLLVVSLVVSSAISIISAYFKSMLPLPPLVIEGINLITALGIISVFFALIFKVLPNVKIQWRDVWPGAIITAILFTIGKFLISLYIGKAAVASSYGAAGSLVVILLWVYYASQILFYGAEYTRARYMDLHHAIEPEPIAVSIEPGLKKETKQTQKLPSELEQFSTRVLGYMIAGIITELFSKRKSYK